MDETDKELIEARKLNVYVSYSEYDINYENPTLVIQSGYGTVGYAIDPETLEIGEQVCICGARSDDECFCGGC